MGTNVENVVVLELELTFKVGVLRNIPRGKRWDDGYSTVAKWRAEANAKSGMVNELTFSATEFHWATGDNSAGLVPSLVGLLRKSKGRLEMVITEEGGWPPYGLRAVDGVVTMHGVGHRLLEEGAKPADNQHSLVDDWDDDSGESEDNDS